MYTEKDRGLPEAYPLQGPSFDPVPSTNGTVQDNTSHFSKTDFQNASPKRQKTMRLEWKRVWFDFSQGTTLHGINKITEDNPFTIRR